MAKRKAEKAAFLGVTELTLQKVTDRWFDLWKTEKLSSTTEPPWAA